MSGNFDPVSLAIALALLALLPLVAVMTTSFLKLAVVFALVRNALGVQQVPPNMALYGLAAILSVYVMGPVVMQVGHELQTVRQQTSQSVSGGDQVNAMFDAVTRGAEPLREFMLKNSRPEQRDFFVRTARHLWGDAQARDLQQNDLIVLVPAFLVTELTEAFQIGFLLYLPFVIIDLIVSNILLAMGMMMVSPVTISMPLKLFLFVMVDGWTRLVQGLVLSYS
ncbi:type III secretion system export apparatus subunit SctR [Castellaniella sp.]|uniref:type III secretion system export apparatus subunit SctR n=1 Tax=Castellaniella sp. TaxID=1955812 RepID=UPI002AFF58B0|nr:type III secretion system export apparatus subunit SctR [Castellaniella sp.]